MSIHTPLCLQLTCTGVSSVSPVNSNNCYNVTVTLPGVGQTYYSSDAGQYLEYTCDDIKVGYWLAGSAAGFAWRIIGRVSSSGPYRVVLKVEDDNNFNQEIDNGSNQFGGAPQLTSDAGLLICFQLNNDGVPVFSPTYYLYSDNVLPQLPSDIMSRFAAQNPSRQYVDVHQVNTLNVGDPIWFNPSGALYQKSTNANAQYTIGIVSSTDNPDVNAFTYKAFGTYYRDVSGFFSETNTTVALSLRAVSGVVPGSILYIDTTSTTGVQYTVTPPAIAIPAWIYLGLDTATGKELGILSPFGGSGSSSGSGAAGATGARGATGLAGASGATGAQGLAGASGGTGATGAQGAQGLAGASGGTGATGSKGIAGATGQQGIQGDTGQQGIQGIQGIPGPTGSGGGSAGTYANDTWMYTNLIGPPPSITFSNVTATSSQIFVPWTYPTQQPIGLVSSWVPVINTLTVDFSVTLSNSSVYNVSTLTNVSTNYINYHNTTSYVTGMVLSKLAGSSGIQSLTFPGDVSPRNAYVYYDTTLANISSSTSNTLTAWYANTNPTTNASTVSLTVFLTAGPPSVPRSLSLTSVAANSATFNYTAPLSNDITDPTTVLTISLYTVTYSSVASSLRYGTPVSDSLHTLSNATNLSYAAAGLYPDSLYTFSVNAKNSGNMTGSNAAVSTTTTNIVPTSALSAISFGSRYYSHGTIKNILSGTTVTTLVNSSTAWTSASFVTPIHNVATRGSTGSALMSITATYSNAGATTTGPSVAFDGFPATVPSAATTSNMTLTPSAVTDTYSVSSVFQQGFFLQSANTLTLGTGIFAASQSNYVLTVAQSGTFTGSGAVTFQYDTPITTAPGITAISFNFNGSFYNAVSGVNVIYGSPVFVVTATASNMGNYFYSSPLLSYTNAIVGSWSPTSETDLTHVISGLAGGAFSSSIGFSNASVTLGSLVATYVNAITLSATANNIYATSASVAATSITAIVDGPSIQLVYTTLPQTLPSLTSGTTVIGYRVTSATAGGTNVPPFNNVGTPYANTAYDNTADISSLQELQVSNGTFTTPSGQTHAFLNYGTYYYSASSLNTLNYSGIGTSGYRYVTFAWRLQAASPLAYNTLSFIMNLTSVAPTKTANVATVAGSPIRLFYRFEDVASSAPTDTSSVSSAWIDGNSLTSGFLVGSGNYFNPTTYTGTPNYGLTNIVVNGTTSTTFTETVPTPLTITSQTINLYCRVGIPMNSAFSFKYMSAVMTAS